MSAHKLLVHRLAQDANFRLSFVAGIWVLGLLALSYLVYDGKLVLVLAMVMAASLIVAGFRKPEIMTLVSVFVIYTNFSVVFRQSGGLAQLMAISPYLLLCLPFAVYLFMRREKLRVDHALVLLLVFLVISMISSFSAKDLRLAMAWIANFGLEGIALYFLMINLVRNLEMLKKVMWVLIVAAGFLGSLSLYQEVTQSYENTFGGFAQRNIEEWVEEGREEANTEGNALLRTRTEVNLANRAGGPTGGPNRYAQIMIMILPLALFSFWREHSRKLKLAAALGALLILSGILLSYSRGAFVTLLLMVALLVFMRYLRLSKMLVILTALLLIMLVVSPGYFVRMQSILGVEGVVNQSADYQPDAVTRGRLTEMLAALNVFLDYPVFGVGPGQFTPFYSKAYMRDPDIAFRSIDTNRRAHILYFELAAETGIVGITVFMAIVILLMYRLLRQRRYWADSRPDLANLATAFLLGIVGYLGTAIFLQLSYQRYYWLLLGLAGAALQIFREQISGQKQPSEVADRG